MAQLNLERVVEILSPSHPPPPRSPQSQLSLFLAPPLLPKPPLSKFQLGFTGRACHCREFHKLRGSRGDGVASGLCGGGRHGGRAAMRLGCRQPRRRAPHGGPERAVAPADDKACRVPPHRRGWMLLLVFFCSRPLPAFLLRVLRDRSLWSVECRSATCAAALASWRVSTFDCCCSL